MTPTFYQKMILVYIFNSSLFQGSITISKSKARESLLTKLRAKPYKRQGFSYDGSKRMWSRERSFCHNAPIKQVVSNPKASIADHRYHNICVECSMPTREIWNIIHV